MAAFTGSDYFKSFNALEKTPRYARAISSYWITTLGIDKERTSHVLSSLATNTLDSNFATKIQLKPVQRNNSSITFRYDAATAFS